MNSEQLLPQPFDWITIPAGTVTIHARLFEVATFQIAKYPLTNGQYAKFVEAGGYEQPQWWASGWAERQKRRWIEPIEWQNSNWNDARFPVVGVSWYEAMAYTVWLSETTGEMITLPTEPQWQRAAQGDTRRAFPWGNGWNWKRCNNSVSPCSSLFATPVELYEGQGDSPFGVVDMCGNVDEWCLTQVPPDPDHRQYSTERVVRGGSWASAEEYDLDLNYHRTLPPDVRWPSIGFRLIRSA